MSRNDIFKLVLGSAAIVGATYMAKACKQLIDIKNKLDRSIGELSEMTEVDISETVIEAAVERKVNAEVSVAVKKATTLIIADLESSMKKEVKKSVEAEYEILSKSVKDKLDKEVENINLEKLRKEVINEAKKAAADKFENDLDDVLEKYNNNLEKITQIYSSISQSMNPKQTFNI